MARQHREEMPLNDYALHARSHDTDLSDVTYITARPHGVRGVIAALTRRNLRNAGVSNKPNVMLGDMTGLLGNKRIAERKFENFKEFAQLFPEYCFVLVGDSGQGDAALGALMLERYPNSFRRFHVTFYLKMKQQEMDYANEQGFDFFARMSCALRAHRDGLFRQRRRV